MPLFDNVSKLLRNIRGGKKENKTGWQVVMEMTKGEAIAIKRHHVKIELQAVGMELSTFAHLKRKDCPKVLCGFKGKIEDARRIWYHNKKDKRLSSWSHFWPWSSQ